MSMPSTYAADLRIRLSRSMPAFGWLPSYRLSWLRADVIAGITLAAYLLPAGLGDASLARLPAEAGLYACMFGGLVFWLFCSSRHTTITVTSAISLLIGSSLGNVSGGDPSRFAGLAAGTALLVAAIAFTAWLFKAGSIINFVSESVMIGFKCGVALYLISTQLPKLLGFHGAHGTFWQNRGTLINDIGKTNPAALAVGATALAVLVLGKIFLKGVPVALLVVVGGVVASRLLDLDGRGVKLLGEVPQGLPALGIPDVRWADLQSLLPLAIACFMLASVETAAIGRTFAAKWGRRFDPNQEILALGASNLVAGLGQGYPISGGMSQSLVNESGGARTPISGVVASGAILAVVLFFSHLLSALPQPALAAIVLAAVVGLISVPALKHLWHSDRREFAIAMVAMAGVLTQGLLRGVMIGAIISLVLLIRRAAMPPVNLLGRIPGTNRFSDCERHRGNETIPGIVVVRPGASMIYFNMEHVRDRIMERIRAEKDTRLLVLDLSEVSFMDVHAAEMLSGLTKKLASKGIVVDAVEAHAEVRERLRAEGLDEKLGGIDRFQTVADAVDGFLREHPAEPDEPAPSQPPDHVPPAQRSSAVSTSSTTTSRSSAPRET